MMLSFSPETLISLDLPDGVLGFAKHYRNQGARSFVHHHQELELNFVLRGSGAYLAGAHRYDLTPGALVWLFPEQDHVLTAKSPDLEMWIAVFRPELLDFCCRTEHSRVLCAAHPDGHFRRFLSPLLAAPITRICEDILAAGSSVDRRNAGLGYLLTTAWDAYQAAGAGADQGRVHPAVQRAVQRLRGDDEGVSIPEIAREAGLSVSRLSDVFKRETGATLTEFRNQQRLERFARLYGAGERRTMLDAALEAGFGSYLQFYRVFQKEMGCAPSEHRRRRECPSKKSMRTE
ncbi:AraC family transcriptional regulator [Capsulimonas corticalis]|uniref:AraC family transcriptional regulator n=1 Tax=Capsulimonas corticalis TaxID=2219043 RepID=A0A402D699_9BACT|nr:AraC family transcriptional regulator [Capsulimonas corticalis]BDI32050.1 AraC family transcriptional regulator [Capsulimonas corticalis]